MLYDFISTSTTWLIVVGPVALLSLWLVLRRPIRRALTPRGIRGVPALPHPVPLWGDLPAMGKMIGDHDSFSYFFDWCAKELGPICQVRVGWFMK